MADICINLWQQWEFVETSGFLLNDNGSEYNGQTKNNLLQNHGQFRWSKNCFETYFENGTESGVDWLFVGQYFFIPPTELES